jgi:hypothetical protein
MATVHCFHENRTKKAVHTGVPAVIALYLKKIKIPIKISGNE